MLYKKGDRGEDVKRIQEALKITADGIFGPKTEAAVKAFQYQNGLKPVDGIVGPKTWGALLGGVKPVDIDIVKGYINSHITHLIGRPVRYIAIHYTAGGSSKPWSALGVRKVFLKRSASADFAVDDRDIVQINPDLKSYYCWSVGDKKNPYGGGGKLYGTATNKNTISIEICSNLKSGTSASAANHEGWYFTDGALDNALKLVRWLMGKFGIPKERVVRHYDISVLLCRGVPGWIDAPLYATEGSKTKETHDSRKWEEFWEKI